jgi:hypothetical protein
MSKMPPQGSCSIPQILDLFFSHAANISLMCRFQMAKYAGLTTALCSGKGTNTKLKVPLQRRGLSNVLDFKNAKGVVIYITAPLNSFL